MLNFMKNYNFDESFELFFSDENDENRWRDWVREDFEKGPRITTYEKFTTLTRVLS